VLRPTSDRQDLVRATGGPKASSPRSQLGKRNKIPGALDGPDFPPWLARMPKSRRAGAFQPALGNWNLTGYGSVVTRPVAARLLPVFTLANGTRELFQLNMRYAWAIRSVHETTQFDKPGPSASAPLSDGIAQGSPGFLAICLLNHGPSATARRQRERHHPDWGSAKGRVIGRHPDRRSRPRDSAIARRAEWC